MNKSKICLIFGLFLVFCFVFTGCDNGSTGGSSGGGNSSSSGSDGGGGVGGSNSFANTNWTSYSQVETRLSFITSENWAIYMMGGVQWMAGNYTVSGGTATLRMSNQEFGKATISGNTLTLTGFLANYYGGSSWRRE